MTHISELDNFERFLTKRGAVMQPLTNEWEVLRFKTVSGVSVIYKNKAGFLTFTGESLEAFKAYKNKKPWRAVAPRERHEKDIKLRLFVRDGKQCFCCRAKLPKDQLTIEHLLSVGHGGTNNINNLVVMCKPCNLKMGKKPLAIKIKMIADHWGFVKNNTSDANMTRLQALRKVLKG